MYGGLFSPKPHEISNSGSTFGGGLRGILRKVFGGDVDEEIGKKGLERGREGAFGVATFVAESMDCVALFVEDADGVGSGLAALIGVATVVGEDVDGVGSGLGGRAGVEVFVDGVGRALGPATILAGIIEGVGVAPVVVVERGGAVACERSLEFPAI